MNGTAGQEGETVRDHKTWTHALHATKLFFFSTLNISEPTKWVVMRRQQNWGTVIEVRGIYEFFMALACVCVSPWAWLMQRLCWLWHRSLLLIISQHAFGQVPPSSARPAKDPPSPTEFCNHTPHSPAALYRWALETDTLAHMAQHKHARPFDVRPGTESLRTPPEAVMPAWAMRVGRSDLPGQQTVLRQEGSDSKWHTEREAESSRRGGHSHSLHCHDLE